MTDPATIDVQNGRRTGMVEGQEAPIEKGCVRSWQSTADMTGLSEAENAWDEARARSPLRLYGNWNPEWFEYWDYVGMQYSGNNSPLDPLCNDILGQLSREGMLAPGDRVLDVGCGPGTFTLPLTLNAVSVTGIDPSAVMLSKAESTAAATCINNLCTVRTTWESYEPEAPYDLVFAAFCPGIHDRRTLWKMEKASRRSCCYVTGDVGQFRLLSQLWGDVSGESCSCDARDISYPFEILRKAGRNPQLHLFRQPSLEAAPAPSLVDGFVAYFRSFPGLAMAGREQIRRHIDSISKNGHVELCRERRIWMLSWNVPQ